MFYFHLCHRLCISHEPFKSNSCHQPCPKLSHLRKITASVSFLLPFCRFSSGTILLSPNPPKLPAAKALSAAKMDWARKTPHGNPRSFNSGSCNRALREEHLSRHVLPDNIINSSLLYVGSAPGLLTQRLASTACKEPSQGVGVGSLAHSKLHKKLEPKEEQQEENTLGRREEGQAHENVGAHACQLRLLPLAVILSFLFFISLYRFRAVVCYPGCRILRRWEGNHCHMVASAAHVRIK